MNLSHPNKYIIFILFFTFSLGVFAQKVILKGSVKDSLQKPLSYANVIAKPINKSKNSQFTITDNEGSYRFVFQKGDTVTISISYLGYKPIDFQFIATKNTTKDFILESSPEQLDEVVIEMPVTVRGDTTIYRTDKFITGEERKLKNVLKKLPGVEVSKDGSVSVQGKKVTKMLVDGKKFFGGNSKLAIDNIPADAVDKVQVIDNYNEVAFLKNLTDSDELAMNIGLKKDKKRFVFGSVEAGKGNDDFYKSHANLFYYSPKANINLIANINNIAEKTFTFKDYLNFQGGVNAIFSGNFSFNGGDFSQFLENRDVLESVQKFGALNITKTTSDKLDISGYFIVSKTEEENRFETQNDYSTFNEFRANNILSENFLSIGKLGLEYKPNDIEQWYFRTQVKATNSERGNDIISTILNQTNTISTSRELDNIDINQNIEWHKKYSEKHTFSSILNYKYIKDERFSLWQTEDNILQGLIPVVTNQNLLQILQDKNRRKHNLDAIFKYFWEINNNNHIYTTVGNKYLQENFITDDRQKLDNGFLNNFSSNGFGNDLDFTLNNLFLGIHYKFRAGIFTVKQGVNLHNYSWIVDQQNKLNQNKWVLLPDFLAKIEFNSSKKIELRYSLKTFFSDASKFVNQFYLQSYNSVFRGNSTLENNLFHSARIYYSRFSLYRGLIMNLSANYSKQIRGVRNTVEFDGINQFLTPQLFKNPSESVDFRGNIYKKINKVRYKLDGSTSFATFLQEVDNTFQKNRNDNYSYNFGLETTFESFPNIEIGFKKSVGSFTSSNNKSRFKTNEPFVKIDYDFLKGFIFSFDYTLYDFENKTLNQKNRFDVANFTLSYRKENSAWSYKVFSNNLFNTGFKRNSSFSQFLISDTRTFILSRVLMFSIGYNL